MSPNTSPSFLPALLVLSSAGIILSSCASQPVLRPPSDVFRAGMGRVQIVADSNVERIRFQVPDSKADVRAEVYDFDPVTPRDVAPAFASLAACGPAGAYFAAGLIIATPVAATVAAPVLQETGRAIRVLGSDSAEQVAAARATMTAAVAGHRFDDELRSRVAAHLAQLNPAVPQVPRRNEADTILELMVFEPAISGAEGSNPRLGLHVGLRIRLLDATTRQEIYYDYLDYRSRSRHTLVEWAAHDARAFQVELERCLAEVSAEVVAQIFLRPTAEPVDNRALATAGISRRPPQPLSAAGGTQWSPAYRPARYARPKPGNFMS